MGRSLLQLIGVSLLAVLALLGLECPSRGRQAHLDEAPDLRVIAAARSPR